MNYSNMTERETEIELSTSVSEGLTSFTAHERLIDNGRNLPEKTYGKSIWTVLFSQFTSMLDRIAKCFAEEGISYFTLTGDTPKQMRVKMAEEFNNDSTNVFLISLKAGGTGLNLTGADIGIHYDPWWNVAMQNQATDRAHRIGQKNKVNVYKLIAKDSIEEKILKLQESKEMLAESVVSDEVAKLTTLSKEELLKLLD